MRVSVGIALTYLNRFACDVETTRQHYPGELTERRLFWGMFIHRIGFYCHLFLHLGELTYNGAVFDPSAFRRSLPVQLSSLQPEQLHKHSPYDRYYCINAFYYISIYGKTPSFSIFVRGLIENLGDDYKKYNYLYFSLIMFFYILVKL